MNCTNYYRSDLNIRICNLVMKVLNKFIPMKYITKLKLAAIHQICDIEDKSTEFMLQLMQDAAKVELDTVMNYMKLDEKEKKSLFKDVNSLTETIVQLENIF